MKTSRPIDISSNHHQPSDKMKLCRNQMVDGGLAKPLSIMIIVSQLSLTMIKPQSLFTHYPPTNLHYSEPSSSRISHCLCQPLLLTIRYIIDDDQSSVSSINPKITIAVRQLAIISCSIATIDHQVAMQ